MPIVQCPLCGEPVSDAAYRCPHCLEVIEGVTAGERPREQHLFMTSTDTVEGRPIVCYHGYITAEAAIGLGILKTFAAGLSDIAGTESKSLGGKFAEAKEAALNKLQHDARKLGANALVGMRMDIGSVGDFAVFMAKGTAVTIADNGSTE